jgi:hypothetical protein
MRPKGRKSAATLCLCITALLLSHGRGIAEPSRFLKGVTIITYTIIVEKTSFGEDCGVDQNSLAIALQFVANQSTRLKVMPTEEADRRFKELMSTRDKIFKEFSPSGKVEDMVRAMNSDRYVAVQEASKEFVFPPYLTFIIEPVELPGVCVGSVKAEVSAHFDTTKMRPTGTTKYQPQIPIWSNGYIVKGPQRTFSDQVRETAESQMKQLVNDWTASQDLPESSPTRLRRAAGP